MWPKISFQICFSRKITNKYQIVPEESNVCPCWNEILPLRNFEEDLYDWRGVHYDCHREETMRKRFVVVVPEDSNCDESDGSVRVHWNSCSQKAVLENPVKIIHYIQQKGNQCITDRHTSETKLFPMPCSCCTGLIGGPFGGGNCSWGGEGK